MQYFQYNNSLHLNKSLQEVVSSYLTEETSKLFKFAIPLYLQYTPPQIHYHVCYLSHVYNIICNSLLLFNFNLSQNRLKLSCQANIAIPAD